MLFRHISLSSDQVEKCVVVKLPSIWRIFWTLLKSTTKGKPHGRRDKADLSIRYFKITTKIVLIIVLCFCKDIPVVTVINHKQSFSLSRKYSNIHEEEYLRTLALASTAFSHNKIKLHFVTFYRSHCHFHHSLMYSVNKPIKNNIIHSNFST